MSYSYDTLFLLFMLYSIMGWLLEVTCKLIEKHKFINRGFLIGPYCPIYGWGSLIIILTLNSNKNDMIGLFLKAIVICSILEYMTSYIMEKLFHARWWDYSEKKFNLNGRICLETMIPFGVLACIVIYGIQPVLYQFYTRIPNTILYIITILLFILYLIDNFISFHTLFHISSKIKLELKDNTKEISNYVKEKLKHSTYLNRRIVKAFPNFQVIITKVKNKVNEKLTKK